ETTPLREATTLGGEPIPEALRGKIWIIGDSAHNEISWEQQSDVELEIVGALHEHRGRLGVDILRDGATFLAFSQAAPATALALRRLEVTFDRTHPHSEGVSKMRLIPNAGAFGANVGSSMSSYDEDARDAYAALNDSGYVRSQLSKWGV